jgi:hypothetical protein
MDNILNLMKDRVSLIIKNDEFKFSGAFALNPSSNSKNNGGKDVQFWNQFK